LYIVDSNGVWGTAAKRHDIFRVMPSEELLRWTFEEIRRIPNSQAGRRRWSTVDIATQGAGFPYWAWYGDWKSCNHRNIGEESVPIFTTCADVACSHAIPTPSYMHVVDHRRTTEDWFHYFKRYDNEFPWESKQRKLVWRGALSENRPELVFESQRWRLCKLVHELSDPAQKQMFDVGLTTIPKFLRDQIYIDETLVGGVASFLGEMTEFQKYTAILDMDGNSWSSRFRTMLCYNSVAVKVEPAYVDYFFSDLIPWKHYIPIKNDLSDLVENVAFALDPANDPVIHEIIASANQWCSERSTRNGLVYDMLDTMEVYLQLLDRSNPSWQDEWKTKKNELFSRSDITLTQLAGTLK
jgi:Glycosyl transferase family 90